MYSYIRVADGKKRLAIYNLLENEIEQINNWGENLELTNELDKRYAALETGKDKGFTIAELKVAFDVLRKKKKLQVRTELSLQYFKMF